MKNGDPRSANWIKQTLKTHERDNEGVHAALHLVSVYPVPPLLEIEGWTHEQALLAHDWAISTHVRASDNINRVPACPAHLRDHLPRHPRPAALRLAFDLIQEMREDNGTDYKPTDEQIQRLELGVYKMTAAGCHFTVAEVSLFAAGENGDREDHFKQYEGYPLAMKALTDVFDAIGAAPSPLDQLVNRLELEAAHISAPEVRPRVRATFKSTQAMLLQAAAALRSDSAKSTERLAWLDKLIASCPHAAITYNDDPDVTDQPMGYAITVESCSRMALSAPSLAQAIDLGMTTPPDEDGNVVASIPVEGAMGGPA